MSCQSVRRILPCLFHQPQLVAVPWPTAATLDEWRELLVSSPFLSILMISKTSGESFGMTLSPTCGGAVGVKSFPAGLRGLG
jgi:hypothetical protein